MSTSLPLEDAACDVLRKAMWGLGVGRDKLAARAGVSLDAVQAALDGALDDAVLRAVAPVLDLDPATFLQLAHGLYQPRVAAPEGLLAFSSPYKDFHVNAYMMWDAVTGRAAVFDTGTAEQPVLDALRQRGLALETIFITHTHGDHVAVWQALQRDTGARVFAPAQELLPGASPVNPGDRFSLGALQVEAHQTTGHTVGGTTYVVHGLAVPVAAVGDAIFAGSMGGGLVSHREALKYNRALLAALPDETILAPGHGPLTTVGLEKTHNPFFAGAGAGLAGVG
jgi:glyoxylase-like metal-dependent hydrolase (beta-lactamase superfamily II)